MIFLFGSDVFFLNLCVLYLFLYYYQKISRFCSFPCLLFGGMLFCQYRDWRARVVNKSKPTPNAKLNTTARVFAHFGRRFRWVVSRRRHFDHFSMLLVAGVPGGGSD